MFSSFLKIIKITKKENIESETNKLYKNISSQERKLIIEQSDIFKISRRKRWSKRYTL